MKSSSRAAGFYMVYAALCVALLGSLFYGAEGRIYAGLGLALCVALFLGVLYRPTRWVASGLTVAVVLCVWGLTQWAQLIH